MTDDAVSPETFPIVGVGVVVLNNNDEVLLIRRGSEPNIGLWTIPGGRQEPGETLEQTAYREINEETGVDIEKPRLVDVVDLIRRSDDDTLLRHYTLVDYAARYKGGQPRPGGDADAVAWISLSEVKDRVSWSETLRIIEEAAHILGSK